MLNVKRVPTATGRRRFLRAFAAGMSMFLASGLAPAQMVVADPMHTIESYLARLQDISENLMTGKRWLDTSRHYTQQLVSGGVFQGQSMAMMDQFQERTLTYGLQVDCPGTPGGDINLWQALSLDMTGDIKAQQLQVCQRIVVAQNQRFNEMVKMLQTVRKRDEELKQIAQDRMQVGSSEGRLAANDNQIEAFRARAQLDAEYWQTVAAAYDGYIVSLHEDQQRLARQALNGGASALGSVVQGVALKGALKALRERDR